MNSTLYYIICLTTTKSEFELEEGLSYFW